VSTDLPAAARPGRAPSASACEPYRELIERALERGRNAMAIWQDLVDMHGFDAPYSSVRRFVQTLRQTAPEPHAVITTARGEKSQVDYGDGPMVRHPVSGKYRRTRLFVLTLGCSRKSVRLLVWQSSAQIWAELHERAFRRLGGTTRVVIGIRIERVPPGHPQQNSRHERMHLTLKKEATKPAAANVLQQQARFDTFVERYNGVSYCPTRLCA
jgi:transposase